MPGDLYALLDAVEAGKLGNQAPTVPVRLERYRAGLRQPHQHTGGVVAFTGADVDHEVDVGGDRILEKRMDLLLVGSEELRRQRNAARIGHHLQPFEGTGDDTPVGHPEGALLTLSLAATNPCQPGVQNRLRQKRLDRGPASQNDDAGCLRCRTGRFRNSTNTEKPMEK